MAEDMTIGQLAKATGTTASAIRFYERSGLLRPMLSTVVFEASRFHPKRFYRGLSVAHRVERVWLNQTRQTLFFVTCLDPTVPWTRSRQLRDRQWDLYVLHYDASRGLLYLQSSDKSSAHEGLAMAVAGRDVRLISGDRVFRALGHINRLVFYQMGVKKHGRRNLRYALYTGANVREALSVTETGGSVKNNVFGAGYEDGRPVTVGCSVRGRVWSRDQGTIPEFIRWANTVGAKLQDAAIRTDDIIDQVLIPEELEHLPVAEILSLDWPDELLHQAEERVVLSCGDRQSPLTLTEISLLEVDRASDQVRLRVLSDALEATLALRLSVAQGFEVVHLGGDRLTLTMGRLQTPLPEYLSDYPPLIRFVDQSELDGNLWLRPKDPRDLTLPVERLEVWDWTGTNVGCESMWRRGEYRPNSIQERVAEYYRHGGYGVVFDDDAPGEASDLVCLKEEPAAIHLALVHCKFAGGAAGGERIGDITEVAAQAVRSAKWRWRFRELCRHVVQRERRLTTDRRPSRFIAGSLSEVNR